MTDPAGLTHAALAEVLRAEGFPPDAYSLGAGRDVNECYVLAETTDAGWEFYYAERGLKSGLRVFATESEACTHFLDSCGGTSVDPEPSGLRALRLGA
ncbi:hypothetical protein [Asanoa siamensis]|uniref:Immunity protein 35 of polymorphic toxin system n=1 Tax=Asanoa siamensis TaxID=926357 RepID=A0ABQ4CI30_9ACTN|nr:hypothetical protein [Asanoa siamensis]GIF70960.1 hypothetical protein Asi02nite_04780 [Asanoa siamensis]